jgi:hypothetical protein
MRGGKTNRLMKFDIDFETMTLSGGVYVDNEILAKKKKSKHRDD